MEKNEVSKDRRCIRVLDENGAQIGSTYPKRAAGLIKKGRAQFVNDFDIRLLASDVSEITEELKMDNNTNINVQENTKNRLYFNPRDWALVSDAPGYRTFIEGPDGELCESFMIGDWSWNWTEIASQTLTLEKHTKYEFVFWLNGGENDQNNETCQFAVLFDGDYDGRLIYNLNRNYIKPLKKVNGWELYCIPFTTGDNENTQLRFMAMRAYMTVMSAGDPEGYADLADSPDEFEDKRPQRHNIIYNDGWPRDAWYGTDNLRKGCADTSGGMYTVGGPDKPVTIYGISLEQYSKLGPRDQAAVEKAYKSGDLNTNSKASNNQGFPFSLTLEDIKNLTDEERDFIVNITRSRSPITLDPLTLENLKNSSEEERNFALKLFGLGAIEDPGQCPW